MKNFLRRSLAALLAAVSILGLCSGALALAPDPAFSDVAEGSWYERYCNAVSETGIMNGTGNGNFSPMANCNRAMFVTILYRLAGSPAIKAATTMTDVVPGSWYADAVAWAQESGVTTGYADGTFGVNDTLNRQSMVTFLHRFAKYMGDDVTKTADISTYADSTSVQSWAKDAVAWAVGEGVIQGTDKGLEPATACTRAMAATVISRMNDLVQEDITRADLERGLMEVCWAYFNKGVKVQYCGRAFNEKFEKWYGGSHRPPVYSNVEDATSDYDLYTVCSDYSYAVYDNAFNFPLLGGRMNYFTNSSFWASGYPEDYAILRWVSKDHNEGNYSANEKKYRVTTKLSTTEEAIAFMEDYENTMRPGDIINLNGNSGHNMVYIGNGYILDSGGTSYNLESLTENRETTGSVNTLRSLMDFVVNENASYSIRKYEARGEDTIFNILRPLNLICIDDGDNDPGNDKLNTSYVMKEWELTKFDPKVRKSGYTLTNSTRSRVKYPAMEIDRTVNRTPYGSTFTGDKLTYTVAVSNKSNGKEYTTWRTAYDGKTYAGDDYTGLVVRETVPAGTKLVSASNNAVVNGNNITWTVDIPKGQTAELTYTVEVTAKQGEKIVATGGWVDYIPSNTIENIVGGTKLDAAKVDALKTFAAQKPAVWNSNEGYKISAKSCDTALGNRIYQEVMGLDLQLPTAQQILDNLFAIKHIQMDEGYTYRLGKPVDTYIYELKDQVSDEYKTVRDMVIDTYAGGLYVYTDRLNGEITINCFRTEYLEPGDIILHFNLSPYSSVGSRRTVKDSKTIVYLGENTYCVLNSDGELHRKINDEKDIWEAFGNDVFIALRPSQGYANVNTDLPAYDKSKTPALTDADANKALEPWTQEYLKKYLEGATPTGWKQARGSFNQDSFSSWFYGVAALDVSKYIDIKMSATTANGIFFRAADGSYSRNTNVPESAKNVESIFVEGAYGGKATKGGDPKKLDASGDLLIGDMICMYTDDGKKHYGVAGKIDDNKYVYASGIGGAGNATCEFGTFSDMKKHMADFDIYYVLRPSVAFGYGLEGASAEPSESDNVMSETTSGSASAVAPADAKMLTLDWDIFYVLRPSQAVSGLDMSKHEATIKNITTETWKSGGKKANQRDFGKWFYNLLGVDLTDVLTQNISYTVGSNASKGVALFEQKDGKYVKTTAPVADMFAGEAKMFVPGMFGGSKATGGDTAKVNDLNSYKPGDLIMFMMNDGSFSYGACAYLGDGKFLTVVNNSSSAFSTEGNVLTFQQMQEAFK